MPGDKASFSNLAEDYATRPVPAGVSVGGLYIALINTALAFSLPTLLLGVQLSAAGVETAIGAFVGGGLVLAIIGSIAGLVGLHNRLSTYMLMRFSFGVQGAKLVAFCMALSLFGWFGVNVYLFAQAAQGLWLALTGIEPARWIFISAGGLLMTAGAIFGFKSIQKLSLFVVPLQVLIFIFLLNKTLTGASLYELLALPAENELRLGKAVSAVVGSFIVAAVIMPDFTRYGRRWWDSVMASFIPYFLASTFAYAVAAFAAIWTGETDIIGLMLSVGLGVSAFVLVIFSSWITNSVNLYGCSLSIASIFPALREWQIAVVSGVTGTVIAFFGILEHFIDFIFSLGIIFTPIAGIYVMDYFVLRKGNYDLDKVGQETGISWVAILSWLLGIAFAYAADREWTYLTGIASCDSLLTAALSYLLLKQLVKTASRITHASLFLA